MPAEDYYLQRGVVSSARLNLQHYIFRDTFGYDVHPSIPLNRENLRIADLGAGTGLWLVKVAEQVPPSAQLDGFDLSDEQAPHPSSLPPNVRLQIGNVTKSAPSHLLGKYDIVNIRLFLAVIQNNDPSGLISHAISLLKPGGYLQWSEFDVTVWKPIGPVDTSGTAAEKVFQLLNKAPRQWVTTLPRSFEDHGLSFLACVRQREHPWQRQMLLDNTCLVTEEEAMTKIETMAAEDSSQKELGEFMLDASRRSRADAKKGIYYSTVFQLVLGQKPESP